jgi:hypothetical protein
LRPPAAVGREARDARVDLEEAGELLQPEAIDLALEVDDGFERHPVVVPAPRVELRVPLARRLMSQSRPLRRSRNQICFWPL